MTSTPWANLPQSERDEIAARWARDEIPHLLELAARSRAIVDAESVADLAADIIDALPASEIPALLAQLPADILDYLATWEGI